MRKRIQDDKEPSILFKNLHKHALSLGLTGRDFTQLYSLDEIRSERKSRWNLFFIVIWLLFAILFSVFFAVFVSFHLDWPLSKEQFISAWFYINDLDIEREPCVVEVSDYLLDPFRPPVDCSFCKGVSKVDRVSDIGINTFEKKYAYSGRPVVIVDGAKNWTAINHFSFNFFKQIYANDSPVLESTGSNCQFFPYKTDFKNLGEVFDMSDERAHMTDGSTPWYIGWSNCDFTAADILRKHYERPYFLPPKSESSRTDWIFMGSPGYGAHMHIDHVHNPSWQAQITGRKRWTLEPPPECYYVCPASVETTIHPGEIIVVDTNKWFHSTLNVGDDISITIGSEYD